MLKEVRDCDSCCPVRPRAPSKTDPRKSVAIMLASLKIELCIMAPEKSAAAKARARDLDWWETAEELLVELRQLGWSG